MSLFIAVYPSPQAVEHLADAVERVRRDPAAAGLHWQPPSRWHITMAFLGEGDDQEDGHRVWTSFPDTRGQRPAGRGRSAGRYSGSARAG
jgi:hypothetical protein